MCLDKGNILTRTEYAFTLKDDDFVKEATGTVFEYVYSGEKLISYDHETFVYDAIGNPTTYRYNTLTWSFGRRLTSFGTNTFDYNAEGKRIKKNDISYTYDSQGRLFAQSNGIEYFYDENSRPIAFKYNGEIHYYKKDLLGNVIEILDTTGTTVVKYTYDAWGNHKVLNPDGTENTSAVFIGNINPIRYRSYYFDTETGLFCVSSRYYDPQVGRFISADDISYLDPNTIGGTNLYAYCLNNPVMYVDPTGHSAIALLIAFGIGAVLGGIYGGISAAANNQNVLVGITIGAVVGGLTGLITEVASVPLMLLGTFVVGAGGDVASQIFLDGKSFGEVNLISAAWVGVANVGLALVGKAFSIVDAMNGLKGLDKIIYGTITNSPLLGMGMAINMGISQHSSIYTIDDLYNDMFGKNKQLIWGEKNGF